VKQKLRYRKKRKGSGLVADWPDGPAPEDVARAATYVGSAEHKRRPVHPSFGIDPDLRSDASACDPAITRDQAQEALQVAITSRCVSADFESGFPRYVWSRLNGRPYQGRLLNAGKGEYKGWPIEEFELPSGINERLSLERSDA
jgi:hypothetical protein